MRGSKTVRQLKLVCHLEERRRGYGSGAETGRKTIHRERRNVPWTGRRSNQSILEEINPEYSLEGLMLKLKLQYFGYILWCEEPTNWKRSWCWEKLKAGGEGGDRGWDGWMASPTQWTWIEQTLSDSDRQGSLTCCSPRSHKESGTTEWLSNIKKCKYWLKKKVCQATQRQWVMQKALDKQALLTGATPLHPHISLPHLTQTLWVM